MSVVADENNNTDYNGIDIDTYTISKVAQSIPVLCFISLLMLVGLIGNALVIVTYVKRLEKSTTNLFIFCLAVLDIINCLIIPKIIYDLLHPYTNRHHILCCLQNFFSISNSIASGFIIVCISFDRYFRITRPHNGLSVRWSKTAICVIFFTSLIFSTLTFFVYGTEKVTPDPNKKLYGYKCGTSDNAKFTVIPFLFKTLILFCFGVGVIILLTVYTLLGFKVRSWNRARKTKTKCQIRSEMIRVTSLSDETDSSRDSQTDKQTEEFEFIPVTPLSLDSDRDGQILKRPVFDRELSRSLDRKQFMTLDVVHTDGTKTLPHRKSHSFRNPLLAGLPRKSSIATLTGLKRRMKLSKTTVMFMSATIAFLASHLPFICIQVVNTYNPALIQDFNSVHSTLIMFAVYSYTISYAVNPIIYGFMNPKYRQECKTLLLNISKTIECKTNWFYN